MDFMTWLTTWLAKHPLKAPSDAVQRRYTAEVMEQVRALHAPVRAPRSSWLTWPSFSLGAAVAAAAVLLVVGRMPHRILPGSTSDTPLLLAESPATDEQWVEETMQVLEQLDDVAAHPGTSGTVDDAAGSATGDSLLEELQLFDESELASSS